LRALVLLRAAVAQVEKSREQDRQADDDVEHRALLRLLLERVDQTAHAVGEGIGLQLFAMFRLHAGRAPVRPPSRKAAAACESLKAHGGPCHVGPWARKTQHESGFT